MNLKTYLTWWWMVLTLASCLGLYVAYPNDHSILSGLLGVLVFSFFLYWKLHRGCYLLAAKAEADAAFWRELLPVRCRRRLFEPATQGGHSDPAI